MAKAFTFQAQDQQQMPGATAGRLTFLGEDEFPPRNNGR